MLNSAAAAVAKAMFCTARRCTPRRSFFPSRATLKTTLSLPKTRLNRQSLNTSLQAPSVTGFSIFGTENDVKKCSVHMGGTIETSYCRRMATALHLAPLSPFAWSYTSSKRNCWSCRSPNALVRPRPSHTLSSVLEREAEL